MLLSTKQMFNVSGSVTSIWYIFFKKRKFYRNIDQLGEQIPVETSCRGSLKNSFGLPGEFFRIVGITNHIGYQAQLRESAFMNVPIAKGNLR